MKTTHMVDNPVVAHTSLRKGVAEHFGDDMAKIADRIDELIEKVLNGIRPSPKPELKPVPIRTPGPPHAPR